MTALLVILDAALTLAGGATLSGLVRSQLTLVERALIGVVSGLLVATAVTYGLALVAGLNTATVLGGPLLTLLVGIALSRLSADPRTTWRESWEESRDRWAAHTPWFSIVALAAGSAVVIAIFAHTVYTDPNGLEAGYPTVWADWSQHLSTAASFAVGGNIPPTNPLFSGTTLLYPFLPDFHAATLMTLGLEPGLALAIPGGVLVVVIAMLVVALGRRLGLGTGAGVIAVLICFIGGGIGFIGAFSDACTSHGFTATQCTLQYAVTHPAAGVSIIGWTLHDLPGTIAAQPRAYDGLPSDGGAPPLPNMQWYTPLMAWWLPQRTILFGFAAAISVLILVLAGSASTRRSEGAFALAGLLLGLLPIVHVQTLIALLVLLFVLLWRRRRREWLALLGVGVAVGGVRLAQLVLSPHGMAVTPFGSNAYPWLEPGWLANLGTASDSSGRLDLSFGNLFVGAAQAIGMVGTATWWGFWLSNLGIAVPLGGLVVVAAAARRAGGMASRAGRAADIGVPGATARACRRRTCHLRRVQPGGVPVMELGQHQAARLLVPRDRAAHRRPRDSLVAGHLAASCRGRARDTGPAHRDARRAPAAALDSTTGFDHRAVRDRRCAGGATCGDGRARDAEGERVPHLRPPQRPRARDRRSHRRDGLRRMAVELRHRSRGPLRRCPDDVRGLLERRGHVPRVQPAAQIRRELRGDRQPSQ